MMQNTAKLRISTTQTNHGTFRKLKIEQPTLEYGCTCLRVIIVFYICLYIFHHALYTKCHIGTLLGYDTNVTYTVCIRHNFLPRIYEQITINE